MKELKKENVKNEVKKELILKATKIKKESEVVRQQKSYTCSSN